jgi:hypothetical protein
VTNGEPPPAADEFARLAAQRADQILALLREPALRRWLRFWEPRPRDPELRKLLAGVHAAIRDAERLTVESPETFDEAARTRATTLLRVDPRRLGIDAALELIDGWDQLLIEHSDERYVRDLLVLELARDRVDTTATTWSDVFGDGPAEEERKLLASGAPLRGEELVAARNQLTALYRARFTLYALTRARLALKAHHLWLLTPVLLVLLVGFAIVLDAAGGDRDTILLAALAGAVGATLAGTFKLRDQISTINALRAFSPAIVVQPLIGAVAGLFLLLVLESEVIKLDWGGPEWATDGAIAFVAGFSEPFLLGVVNRVAEIGDQPPPAEQQEK